MGAGESVSRLTPGILANDSTPPVYSEQILGVNIVPGGVARIRLSSLLKKSFSVGPLLRKTNPGFVQNCPTPSVTEAWSPAAKDSAPRARAPARMKTGLMLPISA